MGRVILHIDMNSYFATVEQQANPRLRGRPIAVLGSTTKRTIIVAASIEAKRFGVKTGMRIEEALQICPEIVMVNGEPRKYSSVTEKFVGIFESYTDKVEIFSIDECFLDVTETVHLYSSNDGSLEGAINIAKTIKKRIRKEIGSWISCSVGISHNKFLAKTGSDLQKPDGLVVIIPDSRPVQNNKETKKDELTGVWKDGALFLTVNEALLSLPLEEYCGIGRRILARLSLLGIEDTQKLRDYPNILLNKEYGIVVGEKLKRMSFGIDSSPVKNWREAPPAKSFSCSRTLNKDVVKNSDIEKQILFLLEKVAKRMRDENYWGKEVGLWLRFKNFSGVSKTARIGKWSCDSLEMNEVALKILKRIKINLPVRAIGVYVGQVQLVKNIPQSLFREDNVNEKILATMDSINNRFGEDVLVRARLVKTKLKEVVSGMGRTKF